MVIFKQLHWRILAGLVLGLIFGLVAAGMGWSQFTQDWIAPFGTIFLNLLKLIAVPLVLASLITGVASLSDVRKLSRIGGKAMGIYIATTAISVTLGLVVVNLFQPGKSLPPELRDQLSNSYQGEVESKTLLAEDAKQRGPLQPLIDIVPDNLFASASDNGNMLQIVFVALLLGIGLIQLSKEQADPLVSFFDSLNHLIIRIVDIIMLMAPIGVFGLLAKTITSVGDGSLSQVTDILVSLGYYSLVVVVGLAIQTFVVYPALLKIFTPMPIIEFFKGIGPAQLVAFSTSSSGATLPVTMERCEEKLGVSEEVSSFVLPLGATINMDGTALYQAVAAVFIAQSIGMDLSLAQQITIILTAVLASIGTAAVPSAGIIMLVIILEAIGVPATGIALILGVDRILDMLRTTTNVTGDATVATVVAASEGQLGQVHLDEAEDHVRLSRSDES